MPAQDPIADGVKRSAPNAARVDRQQICDPVEHLSRGLVGKGEQKNISRIDPILEQIGDAISQGARFARAGAGNDQLRTRLGRDRSELLFVQLRGIIDVDRCRSCRALKCVLPRHCVYL